LHGGQPATLGRGDHLAEIALIDEGARSATATATVDLLCSRVTSSEFHLLVEHDATNVWNPLQTLAKRLRSAPES
jgi:CRP-like cAMP-binding protein